jgi:3-dehydroquinate synthase
MEKITIKSNLYDYEVDFVPEISIKAQCTGECAFVIDRNVYKLYPEMFGDIDSARIFLVDAVEHNKNMDTVLKLIAFWQSIHLKKNWKVLCFGGGITQDITCFASNIYLRNIEWYFVPTTLLAMTDSCIGGKCGVNLGELKNQLGVFYPPKKIWICTQFLNTLTREDYINGWGELLKFSLTEQKEFYEELAAEKQYIPCEKIDAYIHKGLTVKKHIIEQDEFDGDLRRILNYGHTFGHALEAYTQNAIPHGTAVIWGIDVANYIAVRRGILDEKLYLEIKQLIRKYFITSEIEIKDRKHFIDIVKSDKKVKNNTIYLILLTGLSHLSIVPVEIDEKLEEVFGSYLEQTHNFFCEG